MTSDYQLISDKDGVRLHPVLQPFVGPDDIVFHCIDKKDLEENSLTFTESKIILFYYRKTENRKTRAKAFEEGDYRASTLKDYEEDFGRIITLYYDDIKCVSAQLPTLEYIEESKNSKYPAKQTVDIVLEDSTYSIEIDNIEKMVEFYQFLNNKRSEYVR